MKLQKKVQTMLEERKQRAKRLIKKLRTLFPEAEMALKYSSNWELLVAVVLSAQCTDKMVNKVTEKLFKKYKKLDDYVNADIEEFEQDIRSTGFYRMKAKNVLAGAKVVKNTFGGKIPKTIEDLITIPGVGRKTANVVLGNAFGIVEGIAVDTHVKRFSIRFDLTDNKTPEKIEKDLMELLPKKDWFDFTYLAIEYGRHIAPARKYDTTQDPLISIYPKAVEGWHKG
ncbi:endonuclease III [Candidatus Wolfebacteria bacterium]|nr:endonuclease III [Candidatus Wolfebacteria bacterium]